jgi:hypothetical protein
MVKDVWVNKKFSEVGVNHQPNCYDFDEKDLDFDENDEENEFFINFLPDIEYLYE